MPDATSPMLVALRAALVADVGIHAYVEDKIFAGRADAGTAFNYIVLPDLNAATVRAFRSGETERGETTIRVWTRDSLTAAAIYAHLKRILDGTALAPAGYYQVAGSVELVTMFPDPVDSQAIQTVVRYRWIAHVSP